MKMLVKTNASNTPQAIGQDIDPHLMTVIDVAHGDVIEIYADRSQLTNMQKRGQDLLIKLPQGGELLLNNYFQDAAATIKKSLLLVEQDGVFELQLQAEVTDGGVETIDISPAYTAIPVTHLAAASGAESSDASTMLSPVAVGVAGVAGLGALAVGAAAVVAVAIAAAAGSMAEKATDDMIKAGGEVIDHAGEDTEDPDVTDVAEPNEDVGSASEDAALGDGVIGAISDPTYGEMSEFAMAYSYATETMQQVAEQALIYV